VEEWEKREGVTLEDGLYRGLMRRGSGDELAAGCACRMCRVRCSMKPLKL